MTDNRWSGKLWAALGTSVTGFGAYTHPLSRMLGARLVSLSAGGGSLSSSAHSAPAHIYNQIEHIPQGVDLITFEAGMIDFRTNAVLGKLYDETLETFYGALYRAIADTLAAHPRATLVFLTPFGTACTRTGRWNRPNDNGDRFDQFVRAIRGVCAWCGVAVIESGQYAGIGGPTLSVYTADGVHPNQAGGLRLAEYIYDRLIQLQPFPALPGAPDTPGDWSLTPVALSDLTGTGLEIFAAETETPILYRMSEGYYFSALWFNRSGDNAIEFTARPTANGSLWLLLASGPAGWIGVGDFGNLGSQKISRFDGANGAVSFGNHLDGPYGVAQNVEGMRWRITRSGDVVHIYQHRADDGLWIAVGDPVDLTLQAVDRDYYSDTRMGILAPQSSASAIFSGTCALP